MIPVVSRHFRLPPLNYGNQFNERFTFAGRRFGQVARRAISGRNARLFRPTRLPSIRRWPNAEACQAWLVGAMAERVR